MSCVSRRLVFSLVVLLFCVGAGTAGAQGLKVYYTSNAVQADNVPPVAGGAGWTVAPGGMVPIPAGGTVYVAFRNTPVPTMRKYMYMQISGNAAEINQLSIRKYLGFMGADTDTEKLVAKLSFLADLNGIKKRWFRFGKCPMWERIELKNNAGAAVTHTVKAISKCGSPVRNKDLKKLAVAGKFGAPLAMLDEQRIDELVLFPVYGQVDVGVAPVFDAPVATGNWSTEFVFVDPDGNPRPEGGVRFFSDGAGLDIDDAYDLDFTMLDEPANLYHLFAFDNIANEYQTFVIDFDTTPWVEPFDIYPGGVGIHGLGGWKGFDNDPFPNAFVTNFIPLSPPNSLEVQPQSNVVREFETELTEYLFMTWLFIPPGFQSGGPDPYAGSHLRLLDQYADEGPVHFAFDMQIDGNDNQVKFYCGNGNPVAQVPYVVDQWVPIEVVVDLENDHCQVFYDQQFICEYAWTAGAFGDGAGDLNIAAIDLFGNGSAPVFYDDMVLVPIEDPPPPLPFFIRGDADGNGVFNPLADILYILGFGFLGGPALPCQEAGDLDGNGAFNPLADGLFGLTFGFLGGPPPPQPFPDCGADPDAPGLGCESTTCP